MLQASGAALTVVVVLTQDDRDVRRTLGSLKRQTSNAWELAVLHPEGPSEAIGWVASVGDAHPPLFVPMPADGAAPVDLAELVATPYFSLLPPGAFLEPDAVARLLVEVDEHPEADLLYSDLDVTTADGVPVRQESLPDWSPQLLRSVAYLRGLVAVRTEAARAAGGCPVDLAGDTVDELALRLLERQPVVVHLDRVLLHRLDEPARLPDRADRVVEQHRRTGRQARLVRGADGAHRAQVLPRPCTVSIVLPTRGGSGVVHGHLRSFVVEAVRSIVAHSYVVDFELVVIHDADADRGYLRDLAALAGPRLTVVDFHGPFNFSAKVNLGAERARGEVLLLLNDDVEVITDDWLDRLAAIVQESDVGAVGAKLLFEDGSIQHAGLMFHQGQFQHVGFHLPDRPGRLGLNVVDREVVGVTAACMAIRRSTWDEVGGMDETLPNNFNDVDLCWRLRQRGYRIVQANSVVMHHYESRTREPSVEAWEVTRILSRLAHDLDEPDPFTFPQPGEAIAFRRDLREWARVSAEVWRTEGSSSLLHKARRRLKR